MKNGRRQAIKCIMLLVIILFQSVSMVNAQELPTSGIGGEHITWTYDKETKTLTFTGYGKTGTNNGYYEMHPNKPDCGDWYVLGDEVERVEFSEGITQISDSAFRDFVKLKEVRFSSTITTIDINAFRGSGLERITIPKTIKNIGYDAFWCSKLKEVVIEEGVKKIGADAFAHTSIEELTLPNSLKKGCSPIGDCGQLKTFNLPSNMKVIEGEWFDDCPNLTQVILPKSLKKIGKNVFDSSSLESITIPKNVEILGSNKTYSTMFFACDNLKQLVVRSKKIKKVYSAVFDDFPKKATIYVPNSKKKEYTKMFRKAKLSKKVKIKAIKDMKK